MRLVIDLQGAQAASRERGIGRYSLQLAQALARNRGNHELLIALNGAFAETIEAIRAAFEGLLPQNKIIVWEAPSPVSGIDPVNVQRRQIAERVREAFLAALKPDWIVVTSLFESHAFSDNAVTSVDVLAEVPTAVVFYDLIPFIHSKVYLSNPVVERWYLEKIDHLRRAKLLLSISESSGREAIEHLRFDASLVETIGTDCDGRFRRIHLTEVQRAHLRTAYGIVRPFVMYTGGIDHRKNIEGLIRAYARLPRTLRQAHQLAVVCAVQHAERERLLSLAHEVGLGEDELVLTGYVPDEDLLILYNACTLFVFPSRHEGFGMPALEAMRCGKAVLAANTSSLPEVVGRPDALFDPFDEGAMAALIERVLTDDAFRYDLERHGLVQSQRFSWNETARRALAALEKAPRPAPAASLAKRGLGRPKLAYVSPLPPDKSGIADYSAELLPALSRWYDLEIIVTQPEGVDPALRTSYHICSVDEFRARATGYDRVLYHFGNSHFHEHMFSLLEEIPGVVVLHDFFLSGIQAYREAHNPASHAWTQALQQSHGYRAVQERYSRTDEIVWRYPANLPVLQNALGVIVHSEFSRTLARQWCSEGTASDWTVIPLSRVPATTDDRDESRRALGLTADHLLVCSFGRLGPHKLNEVLLDAWLASPLASDPKARLVFVGENQDGKYGTSLLRRIRESGLNERILITGWADTSAFRRYLAAADIGVQLRTLTRGETSGTVLDCMNHGLATIVNAHGSMSDLDPAGVWMLSDEFAKETLVDALMTLARDANRRRDLGERAQEIVRTRHAPDRCAEQYFEAIEGFYERPEAGLPSLLNNLSKLPLREKDCLNLAAILAHNFPPPLRRRQLLVDVSVVVQHDAKSGIQRVVRALLREWLENPPQGFQVEPVYATVERPGYRYARRWTSRFLDIPDDWCNDDPVDAWPGDIFVGLDLNPHIVPVQQAFLQRWRDRGVRVWFVVYDLLPIFYPEFFAAGAKTMHERWLQSVSQFDGVTCISHSVADEMLEWMKSFGPKRYRPLEVTWFHLGADVENSVPTEGLPPDADSVLTDLCIRPTFLMVGTLEPRKGHAQVLDAFEQLWRNEVDINLAIVGKQGWMVEALVDRLCNHPHLSKRLFWLEAISDEYLEKLYAASSCLIAASYGEGFGLPLIEAAQHKLPIIARDIPVFREVAGDHAFYFEGKAPDAISRAVKKWLDLYAEGKHPASDALPWIDWKQSARQLLEVLGLNPHSSVNQEKS